MSKKWGAAQTAAARSRALLTELDAVRTSPGVTNVHQTRVACRRLGQSLSVLRPHLPPKLHKRARLATKAVRKYFGPCRDADVLLERLHLWLATHPPDHAGATAAAELVARLAAERRKHTRRLLRRLRTKGAKTHAREIYALFTWCSENRVRAKSKKASAPPASGAADVQTSSGRLRAMLAEQPLDTSAEGLRHAHEVRIVVKACRYGVESLSENPEDVEPFKAQQDALGAVQDNCVLLTLIDDAIDRTPKRPKPGLEHLSQRSGLSALRTDILGGIGAHFVAFHAAHHRGNKLLARLL